MTVITRPKAKPADAIKDASMAKQKAMMAAHYDRLSSAPETGAKVAATFVPGNLNELIMCYDMVNNPRSATVMGLLEEARIARSRGQRAAQQAGSVKTLFGRAKDWFLGNF